MSLIINYNQDSLVINSNLVIIVVNLKFIRHFTKMDLKEDNNIKFAKVLYSLPFISFINNLTIDWNQQIKMYNVLFQDELIQQDNVMACILNPSINFDIQLLASSIIDNNNHPKFYQLLLSFLYLSNPLFLNISCKLNHH